MIQQNLPSTVEILAPEFAPFPVDALIRLLSDAGVPGDPINQQLTGARRADCARGHAMSTTKLRDFITSVTTIVEKGGGESAVTRQIHPLLGRLVAADDWLPASFAQPDPQRYRQYLLHCDPSERFSVVSFVWGPGQRTPVHDHTVWGLIGVLRGAEISIPYTFLGKELKAGAPQRLEAGAVAIVSPDIGDIHEVANAHADRTSISIHVYGGNIGAIQRHVYDLAMGAKKPFISGYSADVVPNLWDRSREA